MPELSEEIIRQLSWLHETTGRIEGKLDTYGTNQLRQDDKLNNYQGRLEKLENGRSKMLGAVSVISAFVGASLSAFFAYIFK